MRQSPLFLTVVLFSQCALCLCPPVVAEEPAIQSEWDRFVITGNQVFSSEQLLEALVGDVNFLLAVHPQADRYAMPQTVQRLLVAGYHQAGFCDVAVDVVPGRLAREATVTIHEGQRFRCGFVQIEGTDQIDEKRLIQRLSQPYPGKDAILSYEVVNGIRKNRWIDESGSTKKLEDPVWKQGKPMRFGTEDDLNKQVRAALRDLGFSQAKAEVRFVNDHEKATTTMLVHLKEEGKPDIIGKVVVEGLKKNSVQQFLAYIGATRGMRANRQPIAKVTERLWRCGRFSEYSVIREKKLWGPLVLKITVKEIPGLPLLDEAISPEAEVYLKARRWIADATRRGDDFVIQASADSWGLTFIQSEQGQIIHFMHLSDKTPDGQPKFGALLLDGEQWLACYSPTGTKYRSPLLMKNGQVKFTTEIGASDNLENVWTFGLSFGYSSKRAKDEPIIRFALLLPPSGFLPFAYKPQLTHTWEGNALISTRRLEDGSDETLRIDKETGAFDVRVVGTQNYQLTFEKGRFEREQHKIEKLTKTLPNTYDEQRSISTLIAYVCQPEIAEAISGVPDTGIPAPQHLSSAIQKLTAGKVFQPLDRFLSIRQDPSEKQKLRDGNFWIPSKPPPNAGLQGLMVYGFAKYTTGVIGKIFPEGSWPLRIVRETGFVLMNQKEHTGKVLQEIYTDAKYGPICHATVAWLLAKIDSKVAARFALRGLEKLNAESFDCDYCELVTGDFGQWMSHLLGAFRSLNSEELEALLGPFGNSPMADLLRHIHPAIQQDAAADQADPSVLHFEDVQEELEAWLQAMAK